MIDALANLVWTLPPLFAAVIGFLWLADRNASEPPHTCEGWSAVQHTGALTVAATLAIPLTLYFAAFLDLIRNDYLGFSYCYLAFIAANDIAAPMLAMTLATAPFAIALRGYVVEFDDTHIRRRWFRSVRTWPWAAATHVGDSFGSPLLHFGSGERIMVSVLARGSVNFLDELKRRKIRIRDHVSAFDRAG